MRYTVHFLLIASAWLWALTASAQPFYAGISQISVPGETPFAVLLAYPTEATETNLDGGPFKMRASRDSLIAQKDRFPLVLYAIGNGRGAGSPWAHHHLILRLAREGFVVVAPFYPGTARPIINRPLQTRRALDAVLADLRFADQLDPKRIGMIGYSFGGSVALTMGGAKPNLALLSSYCRENRDDQRACDGIPVDGSLAGIPSRQSDASLPLRALVLLEPFGALFGKDDLQPLDMPVLIYHALQSDLKAEGNALSLASNLPKTPRQVAVAGGHGVFIAPCPPIFSADAAGLCSDPPGVDRAAVHRQVEVEVSDFLRSNLRSQPDR